MIACRMAAMPKGVNALKAASKVTLPLLLTKSSVCVTPKKLIGKPMGTAADDLSSGRCRGRDRAFRPTGCASRQQAKDKRIAVIRGPKKVPIARLSLHRLTSARDLFLRTA